MTFKPLASCSSLLVLFSITAMAPSIANAASPPVAAAIATIAALPEDTAKFEAYCELLGEMESVPDNDTAKYEALEDKLDDIIDSYGGDVLKAWDTLSEVEPETDDGREVAAAFEAIEAKCP